MQNGTGPGVPTGGTNNTIIQLIGDQATNPATGASSPLAPFGFFFASPTTLYVADEGNATITTTDAAGNTVTKLVSDPLAGLQKWVLLDDVWTLEYVLQAGLHLNEPEHVLGFGPLRRLAAACARWPSSAAAIPTPRHPYSR